MTKFWREANFFGDGANGLAMQGFVYYYGSASKKVKTDVVENASRAHHGAQWRSIYSRGEVEYPTLQEALDAWKADHAAEKVPGAQAGSPAR